MRPVRIPVMIAAAVALAVGATACDDDTALDSSASRAASSTVSQPSASQPVESPQDDDVTDASQTKHQTIADYIAGLGVKDEKAEPGVNGAPNLSIPTPANWKDAGDETPDYSVGAIVYHGPEAQDATYKANIVALLSKLPPTVDADAILRLAGGELQNLPKFTAFGPSSRGTMSGFRCAKIAGTYDRDGMEAVIAQQTVVIPGDDALYVLQLNATSDQAQADALSSATQQIDRETTIDFG